MLLVTSAFSSEVRDVAVLYPKDRSVVGAKVNLVLDPTEIPFFQVTVNGMPYPVVDTSQGAHAFQGLALVPGFNIISVNVLAPAEFSGKDKKTQAVIASRSINVYSSAGAFGKLPPGFTKEPFHTRERESTCSSCHRLEVEAQDKAARKREDVLCSVCHLKIPEGEHIHGPAAVWNCLSCHDPELYPAKYAFSSIDPWKVTKYSQSVEPMLFTVPAAGLFSEGSAVLLSTIKAKEAFAEALGYVQKNPGDKVRLEVHTDATPLKQQNVKGKKSKGFKDNQALSAARARALSALMGEAGLGAKNLTAVGMGEKLPKTPNNTPEGRELNNRVEIVVYPADVKVINSQKLPVLKDRERVVVTLAYSQGPPVRKLRVVEQLPKGMQYVKGSGFLKGNPVEPRISAAELVWDLGDRESNFTESVYYVLKKTASSASLPADIKVLYRNGEQRDQSRMFDPGKPSLRRAMTITETCQKCHAEVVSNTFKHGPVDAGYCSLCHDPHASPNDAWLRKPVWALCTTCHPDQGNGVHVVAGYSKASSHPTRGKKDRSRPGKSISCTSCHDAHGGEHVYFFAYDVKNRVDLCKACHKK